MQSPGRRLYADWSRGQGYKRPEWEMLTEAQRALWEEAAAILGRAVQGLST